MPASDHSRDRSSKDGQQPTAEEQKDIRSGETFPPFSDPAFSSEPAKPPVKPNAPKHEPPPKDTQYEGHPDFSQDAAKNKPPLRRPKRHQ